jgi:chromosome partitioning protein
MGFLSRKNTPEEPAENGGPPPVAKELERMEEEAMEGEKATGTTAPVQEPDHPPAAEAGASPQANGDVDAGERELSTRADSNSEEAAGSNSGELSTRADSNSEEAAGSDLDEGPARLKASDLMAPDRRKMMAEAREQAAGEEDGESGKTAEVIVFANQKGGVAKTTTTLNLAVAFAESGYRVLCIDLDPQGNLTMSQGIDPDKVEKSVYDVLVHDLPISEVIAQREIDIAVSSIDLAGAEIAMSAKIGRERSLEKALKEVKGNYDFVCIDTPPSLGLLTVNALTAADKVIVPVQCEYLSMRGLVQLQNTLKMIQENLNPNVKIEGILPTMLDSRTIHAKEAVEILEENFGELVFKSRIRKAIKFAEAPVRGASVLKYDPQGNAADYYRALAKEVLTNGSS